MKNTNESDDDDDVFLNLTEVVNDLLHKLTIRDVHLIRLYSFEKFLVEQHQYITHIRNFYQLNNPQNPLCSDSEAAIKAARTVWEILKYPPTHSA